MVKYWLFIGGLVAAVTKPDKMLGGARFLVRLFFRAFPELRRDIMETEQTFTRGPILSTLLKFALPVLLALLLQAMYGAVDLQVVGKFGTAADISAVSTGSQIMQTVTIVITGLAMGITVLLGQKIGEDRPEEAGAAVGSGICLFLVVAVAATVALELAAPQLAMLMHAPADAFDGTVEYVRICSGGAVFIVAYNLLGSIFRGIGDSRVPLITVLIACILNIGGDLLLVGGFGLNVAGAAIATVFAQAMSVALSLLLIRGKHLAFILRRQDIRFNGAIIGRILKLGSPVALQDLLVNITFLVIIAIANSMGTIPSAGVGVAEKLCAFVMLVPSAYMQSMSAFVAQNIGAGEYSRVRRGYRACYGILAAFALVIFAALQCFSQQLIALFLNAESSRLALETGTSCIRFLGWFYILIGLKMATDGVLRGAGDMGAFTAANLVNLTLRVVLAAVLAPRLGIRMVWYAVPVGWAANYLISFLRYRTGRWRERGAGLLA